MGAFGRLLISRWGGNIDLYNGDATRKVEPKEVKSKKQIEEDEIEEDQLKFEMITKSCEQLIEKGDNMMAQLHRDDISSLLKTVKYKTKLEVWRKDFLSKFHHQF